MSKRGAGLLDSALDAGGVAAADGDARALGGEQAGRFEPDPAGGAGDDADALAKPEIHAATVPSMAPTTVLLVRHGETDWNRARRIQGQSDPPLNERGREQARALAERLAGTQLDAVYASDLGRARETAEILAARLELPVVVDPQLRELDFGSWEGYTVEELNAREPDAVARWLATGEAAWERGESHAELADRVHSAVRKLAEIHAGGQILLVAHGGPVRALLMEADGLDFVTERRDYPAVENCALSRIAVENGTVRRLD